MQTFNDYLELAGQFRGISQGHLLTIRGVKISKEQLKELQEKAGADEMKLKAHIEALVGGELNTKDLELMKQFLA